MKKIDYSGLGLTEDEIKVFKREIEILTSGQERYLDHRDENDYSPASAVKYLTLAGWTDVKQNRLMVISSIQKQLPYLSMRKISQLLHQVDQRFKDMEGVLIETKIFKRKQDFYFSDSPAQGKQQKVVLQTGEVFESIKAAAHARNVSEPTMARWLRRDMV